jgi:hypothetical protein
MFWGSLFAPSLRVKLNVPKHYRLPTNLCCIASCKSKDLMSGHINLSHSSVYFAYLSCEFTLNLCTSNVHSFALTFLKNRCCFVLYNSDILHFDVLGWFILYVLYKVCNRTVTILKNPQNSIHCEEFVN